MEDVVAILPPKAVENEHEFVCAIYLGWPTKSRTRLNSVTEATASSAVAIRLPPARNPFRLRIAKFAKPTDRPYNIASTMW